jgi:histidinol dehydrogenase
VIDLRDGGRLAPLPSLDIGEDVTASVRRIIADVRARGDAALVELTRRFDGGDLRPGELTVRPEELDRAGAALDPDVRSAVDAMIERLRDLHRRQVPQEWEDEGDGVRFGEVVRPVRRAGCYVPGGRAAYPSTVAMTVVPAAVAGVEEIVVATPPRADGSVPEAVLYAAKAAGAHVVARVGGAQAIAALAYGTESILAVDTIVGPGNVWVTAAKREVAGDVGIDGLAGPTELVVVADQTADPSMLAADLVAQAEHDPLASATVVTTEEGLGAMVDAELTREVAGAARADIVAQALSSARVVVVGDLDRAAEVTNDLAPEHLQVLLADPRAFLPLVRNAGAIFLGPWSAVPFGDYGVGSNHVLPTLGTARFASGLRATHFLKVSAVVEVRSAGAARLAPEVAGLARSEGLDGHARAAEVRADRVRGDR